MDLPPFVSRVADALQAAPVLGNQHWRLPCPVCQPVDALFPKLAIWQGIGAKEWKAACLSGNPRCSLSAIRVAIHSLLFAGKTPPKADTGPDSATAGMINAQIKFSEADPIEEGDAVSRYFARYGVKLGPADTLYLRKTKAAREGDTALVEALVDPMTLFEAARPAPVVLGVVLTTIRPSGAPVVITENGQHKVKYIGRRQGLACPIGDMLAYRGGAVGISVRAAHTLRHMTRAHLGHGLAVAKTDVLPLVYLPVGPRFKYEINVAHEGSTLAAAARLSKALTAAGSWVRVTAYQSGAR